MTVLASWVVIAAAFGLVVAIACALAIAFALLDTTVDRYFPRHRS